MMWLTEAPRKASRALTAQLAILALTTTLLTYSISPVYGEPVSQSISISNPAPDATGEVALVDLSGTTTSVIKGFTTPTIVEFSPDNRLIVADPSRHEILSFTVSSGQCSHGKTWKLPPDIPEPVGVHPFHGDSLVVFDRSRRVVMINADSTFDLLSQKDDSGGAINRSVSLSPERFLVVSAYPNAPGPHLLQFDVRSRSWTSIAIAEDSLAINFAPNEIAGSGDALVVWRHGNGTARSGSLRDGVFHATSIVSALEPNLLVSDETQGIYHETVDGTLRHTRHDGTIQEMFQFFPPPTDIAFTSVGQRFAVAHKVPRATSWPEAVNQWYPQRESFNWPIFTLLALGGSTFGIAWLFSVGLKYPSVSDAHLTNPTLGSPNLFWSLTTIGLTGTGLVLAYCGHLGLVGGASPMRWASAYVVGACLVAATTESFRRRFSVPGPHTYAVSKPPFLRSTILPLAGIFILAIVLLCLGTSPSYRGIREGVFCAALALVVCLCVADLHHARERVKTFVRKEWWLISLPLLVGSVTLFYRLVDIPQFCHPDFTFNSFAAQMFLDGRIAGAWTWGEVPAPIMGTFPEMVGLLLAGPTPLGFRLGSSLFNLTAIFAVYLFGRTYRNARVGFWAAILLAGSIPFMHFGRLPSNGFATTMALWAATLFALAIRYQRMGLWILLGVVSGIPFYLWPLARVGMTAVASVYLLMLLRHPASHLKTWHLTLAGALGFAIMIAPIIPVWIQAPYLFMPRANESLVAFSWGGSFFDHLAQHPFLPLFAKSVGWIFNEADASSQGTVSPGFNSIEATLFACGFVIALIEGFSLNVVLLTLFMITTIVCGVFADGTPWYTRLLPTAPVVAILAARTIDGGYTLASAWDKRIRAALFVTLSITLLWVSPINNFKHYERFEMGLSRPYKWHPTLAIAQHLHLLGPRYDYILLARGEPKFQITPNAAFGTMLPYIMNLRIKEAYDIFGELELSRGKPTAFVVQLKREAIDIPTIVSAYPNAVIETIRDINGTPVAKIALVDQP